MSSRLTSHNDEANNTIDQAIHGDPVASLGLTPVNGYSLQTGTLPQHAMHDIHRAACSAILLADMYSCSEVFRNRRFFHGPTSEVLIMPSSPQPQQADARRSVDHPLTPEAQFLAKYGGFVSPDAAGLPAVLQHQPEHTRKYQGQSHPSCSLREYSALQGVVRRSSQRRTHIAQTRFATTNFSLSCLSQPWQHGRC